MKIIAVPHPVLRQVAEEVTVFDKKFFQFLSELGQTLIKQESPRGVGLAAPQVGKSWRVFAAVLGETNQESKQPELEFFINPKITQHSREQIMGAIDGSERFEGCLSIPRLYGPVPRYAWVEVSYQAISLQALRKTNPLLVQKTARFSDFDARVIQHEYDHLDGVLFTDYSQRLNLPLYVEEQEQWVEVDKSMIGTF